MIYDVTITIPHPSSVLSPNGRAHWRTRAGAAKSLKAMVAGKTRVAINPNFFNSKLADKYSINWYYKGVRPDDDNVIARCKYIKDAMCWVFGIDDRQLSIDSCELIHDKKRAGEVEFSIFYENSDELFNTQQ